MPRRKSSAPSRPPAPILRQLSLEARRKVEAEPLTRTLYVTTAGYFAKASWHSLRARTLDEHVLIYCLQGRGWVRLGGRRSAVSAGDIFVCPAHLEHGYGSEQDLPWSILWAHFAGQDAERLLERLECSAGSAPYHLGELDTVSRALHSVLGAFAEEDHLFGALKAAHSLRQVLLEWLSHKQPRPRVPREIKRVLKAIAERYAEPLSVTELAQLAGWSPAYFARQFRHIVGRAPIDYLVHQRVRSASELLVTTRDSVAVVASAVGYQDPYYFSRVFKGITGLSPQRFRHNLGVG
jgi:AraC family transcriptional regulator of arabinose operon